MIKPYFKGFNFEGYFNWHGNLQQSKELKSISGPTGLIIMVFSGDSIAIKISTGYN